MATYLFQKITDQATKSDVNISDPSEAQSWYRDTASQLTSKSVNPIQFTKSARERFINATKLNATFVGKMMLFNYDPKLKDVLPYYDQYPLVFPIETYSDGFLGLNMHYLPLTYRARLMDALYSTINNKNQDDKTRLKISYELLKSTAKFKYYKPCVKKYLYGHVRSRYFIVDPKEWDMTLMLPLQRFTGKRVSTIYKDSIGKI
jgi:hypothetical protein